MPRSPKKATSQDATVDKKPYAQTPKPTTATAKRSWTKEEKETILFTILDSAQIDWNAIAEKLEGRTPMQAKDQWRQVLLPSIKKNGTGLGGK